MPKTELSFPDLYLKNISKKFRETGFKILQEQEAFCPIKFYDIGALVWYAHIIEWEFPNFSVNNCLENLFKAQEILEKQGVVGKNSSLFDRCSKIENQGAIVIYSSLFSSLFSNYIFLFLFSTIIFFNK